MAATGRAIALGWIDDMAGLLRAVDLVVHNAGGLTSMEALAAGVPVVSYRCLPGHGTANAAVLERIGLSAWPRTPAELREVLRAGFDGRIGEAQQTRYRALTTAAEATGLVRAIARETVSR
ncbi:glycosyltransferase family protein [Paractinoplanes durhamensis]|uniref:hypothetical protein n=1 Tax=Paractinoplanes durhamensis TaxID=113563 RepID=UPI003637F20E